MKFLVLLAPLLGAIVVAAPEARLAAQQPPPVRPPADSAVRRDTIPRDTIPRDTARRDTTTAGGRPQLGLRMRLKRDSLKLEVPAPLGAFGRLSDTPLPAAAIADGETALLIRQSQAVRAAMWGQTVEGTFAPPSIDTARAIRGLVPAAPNPGVALTGPPDQAAQSAQAAQGGVGLQGARPDSAKSSNPIGDLFGQYADLGLNLQSRLEAKMERSKNERCTSTDFLIPTSNCRGSFQPQFDFQFNVRTGGVVADRVHVNVDYDSQREFDASNNISVYYEGKSDEIIQRLEVGNVSFQPPASRFITGGIPAGNYGLQAVGQLGPMSFRTIVAQQKGNVVKDRVFTVGDRTVQSVDRVIEDYQVERRRFFWVIDPRAFPRFPNIDILDNNGMAALAASLPDSLRPQRVFVYRYRPPTTQGTAANNANGPYAVTRFARNQNPIGPYEILQVGVDYYIDPNNLWIVLVTPINRNERLAVSYSIRGPGGGEVTRSSAGGTNPTVKATNTLSDTVNLLWDNEVLPGDTAFTREMRNVYRLGGEDIQRNTVQLKLVVGSGSDQEQPRSAGAQTYLELFGLAQRNNTSAFDVENRLWPRLGDPNQSANAGGGTTKLIRDYFVVFPSLRPFSDSGLVKAPDPVNDSLYRTQDEDLNSARRPPTQYRILTKYSAEGGGSAGSLALGSVQVRPNSEHLMLDGAPLTRDVDYRVDYETGTVTFIRPDTLFPRPRQVTARYEENPLFAAAPTSIFGLSSEIPFQNGRLNFVAISQSQKTTFNRPPLGFEPASSFVAGVSGNFNFESRALTNALDKLPILQASAPSYVNVQGEFATSRPQPNSAGVAYVESFEGEGGVQLPLSEAAWRYGSKPSTANGPLRLFEGTFDFDTASATTLAWQNLAVQIDNSDPNNPKAELVQFFPEQIDPQIAFAGNDAFRSPEQVLLLSLYPRTVGGIFCNNCSQSHFNWLTTGHPGRRWRSLNQSLSPSGVDLSRVEQIEFWALVDTSTIARRKNPAVVLDFGDVSENSLAFAPESLFVQRHAGTVPSGANSIDSAFTGRRLVGYDTLNTERDSVTKSFDVAINDRGLPGDRVDSLVVVDLDNNVTQTKHDVELCRGGNTVAQLVRDTKSNCTVGNRRLDEEDLDIDGFLNMTSANEAQSERLLRYVVDLSDKATYNRIGKCSRTLEEARDSTIKADQGSICWVQVKVPFTAPTEKVGEPLDRRIKAVRLTMISGPGLGDDEFTTLPLARLKLVGSPWVKRAERAVAGVGGTAQTGTGFVIASVVGTQDADTARLAYQSPPGVVDEADSKTQQYAQGIVQINEKSMRLVSGELPLYARAEAFYRFPDGEKNFMGYKELRVWARGRNKGWGESGDLQFYIKLGRDEDNFYFYRTPASSGNTREAWLPEVRVDFNKFYALRTVVQNNFLRNGTQIACTGLDSALVVSSAPPTAPGSKRYAACDGGYIVYAGNPGITPPNLAAVQELAVGIVRVDTLGRGDGGAITPSDSLEVWVDDIRLGGVVNDPGFAGQLSLNVAASDVGSLTMSVSRRDQNFRQLGEQPSYLTSNDFALATSVRLDRFLPQGLGFSLPLSVSYVSSGTDPFFLSQTDLRASGIEGLRRPRSNGTSYNLSVRRSAPLRVPALGMLVNNLTLNGSYTAARSTSEYQTGSSSSATASADWSMASTARVVHLPGFLDRAIMHLPGFLRNNEMVRGLRDAGVRWNPAQVRFATAYARSSDNRSSFSLPVSGVEGDLPRQVTGLTSALRNIGAVQLQPFNSMGVSWNITSLRDLRDYGDRTIQNGQLNIGEIARGERERFLGMDLGLERERQMATSINLTPPLSPWLRPRFGFSTSYSFFRDPNSPSVLREGAGKTTFVDSLGNIRDTTEGAFRLPRRLSNAQSVDAGATIDLARAFVLHTGEGHWMRRIGDILQPVEVTWRRDLRSAFDGVPFTPGVGYQLGIGGVGAFREAEGVPATSAGVSYAFGVSNSLQLPFNLRVQNRYTSTNSTAWARRLDAQSVLESDQHTFPDVSVGWTFQPRYLRRVITSFSANATARVTKASTFQPTTGDGTTATATSADGLRGEQTTKSYPLDGSITWAFLGGLTTRAQWNRSNRTELRTGGLTVGRQEDITGQVGRSFKLPAALSKQRQDLRWQLGLSSTTSQSYFQVDQSASSSATSNVGRRRVADNGRWSVNTSADTQVNENLTFTFQLSRVTTFDNLSDRRFSQLVATAVLHLSFAAGEIR